MDAYRSIFQHRNFRLFWIGITLSALGDSMAKVALTWYVYESTGSSRSVGILMLFFTGPVIVGGFLAGYLLDRYDRRNLLLADSLIRGFAMLTIPLASQLGSLHLWHIYLVAAVYGFLMMIPMAGGPAMLPDMVPESQLATGNALEMITFTSASVFGPFLAGFLIDAIGVPSVIAIEAVSYFAFAGLLAMMSPIPRRAIEAGEQTSASLKEAVRLLVNNRVLLVTTLMYLFINLGSGFLFVLLPVYATETLGGTASTFGMLTGAIAVGELAVAVITGTRPSPRRTGIAICVSTMTLGFFTLLMLPGITWLALIGLFISGGASGPLTIWAQTLRMQIIPYHLRGRTFALLRTMMQAGNPIGGLTGGFLLPVIGVSAMIWASALTMGLPGVAGLFSREIREAGPPSLDRQGSG